MGGLDRSAGIASACGAEVVVFHPGFLLGRSREDAVASVVEQLGTLRERLEGKGRAVPFGVEVMGRVRDLGSLDDVVEIAVDGLGAAGTRLRAHARDERRRVPPGKPVRGGARGGRRGAAPGVPFHIHFSDIAYANRNEKHHLPYGEGTLRAEPLREALDPLRTTRDGDLRIARRGVEPGDQGDPQDSLITAYQTRSAISVS